MGSYNGKILPVESLNSTNLDVTKTTLSKRPLQDADNTPDSSPWTQSKSPFQDNDSSSRPYNKVQYTTQADLTNLEVLPISNLASQFISPSVKPDDSFDSDDFSDFDNFSDLEDSSGYSDSESSSDSWKSVNKEQVKEEHVLMKSSCTLYNFMYNSHSILWEDENEENHAVQETPFQLHRILHQLYPELWEDCRVEHDVNEPTCGCGPSEFCPMWIEDDDNMEDDEDGNDDEVDESMYDIHMLMYNMYPKSLDYGN